MLLQEAYFGKSDLLRECEAELAYIKKDFLQGKKNPNNHPGLRRMEKNFAEQFGFEKVTLNVMADMAIMNAFTIPFFSKRNFSKKELTLIKTPTGLKFKYPKDKTLMIYITSNLLLNWNPSEIMAVILHEIGHNFFLIDEQILDVTVRFTSQNIIEIIDVWKPYNSDGTINKNILATLMDANEYIKDPHQKVIDDMKKKVNDKSFKTDKFIGGLLNTFFMKFIKTMTDIKNSLEVTPFSILFNSILLPVTLRNNVKTMRWYSEKEQSYNAEKFSDNFAIAHGYGEDNARLWKELRVKSSYSYIHLIPGFRLIYYYDEVLRESIYFFADPHPSNAKRLRYTKQKLEHELRNNKDQLTPQQIREIEDSLTNINTMMKKSPIFVKLIDSKFRELDKKKDKAGKAGIDDKTLFDFDVDLLKDYVVGK